MNFKRPVFFIPVIEFLSVILPGAMVTWFLKGVPGARVFDNKVFPKLETPAEQWIAFLVVSCITGIIILSISSLLDKFVYDKWISGKNYGLSLKTATGIRDNFLPTGGWIGRFQSEGLFTDKESREIHKNPPAEIIDTFNWSLSYFGLYHPACLADVARLQVDSKFFRSLSIAFLLIGIVLAGKGLAIYGLTSIFLCFICMYRYADTRSRSREKAYEYLIASYHMSKEIPKTEHPALAVDNRYEFVASKETAEEHKGAIQHLLADSKRKIQVLELMKNRAWKRTNITKKEQLYCLSGKCLVTRKNAGGMEEVILSKNALYPLIADGSYEFKNHQDEPLILLSIQ